jgi:uncharacterized RDD family membrane protein YckC
MTAQAHAEQDFYIDSVIDHVPYVPALRAQIAMDLRSHIAERMDAGQSIEDVVRQLGDPERLAKSYLGAVPLVAPTAWVRLQAKLVDFGIVAAGALLFALLVGMVLGLTFDEHIAMLALPFAIFVVSFALILYPLIAEYRTGETLGKRIHHLRVVQESGARITFGQSVVRQLPWLFQVFLIDAAFALFTDKSQRAAEIISKTRVVCVSPNELP